MITHSHHTYLLTYTHTSIYKYGYYDAKWSDGHNGSTLKNGTEGSEYLEKNHGSHQRGRWIQNQVQEEVPTARQHFDSCAKESLIYDQIVRIDDQYRLGVFRTVFGGKSINAK